MRLSFAAVALFIQLAVIQVKKGANIALTLSGNDVPGNLVECNSNITLMCRAGVATDTMSWHRNGTKIGDCTFGLCSLTPSASNIYRFDYDTTSGEFNISAKPVTYAESNADFKCNIGAESKSLMLNVTGDFSIHPSTKTVGPNMTELNISTGCIDKTVVVLFQWNIINATNQTDVKDLPKSYQDLIVLNSLSCSSDPNCGGTDNEKKISTLSFEEDKSTNDSYFIAITVKYEQYPTISRVFQFKERPFKIKDTFDGGAGTDGYSEGTPRVRDIVIGSTVSGVSVAGAVVGVVFVIKRVKRKSRTVQTPTYDTPANGSVTATTVKTNSNPEPYQPNGQGNYLHGQGQMINATGSNDVENQAGHRVYGSNKQYGQGQMINATESNDVKNQAEHRVYGSNNQYDEAARVPDTPKEFALVNESVTETTAEFRCKPGPYPTNGQTICLRCLPTSNKDKRSVVEERTPAMGGYDVQIKIQGLSKGCHYRCSVFSEFNNRRSALSPMIEVQTFGNPHTPSEVKAKRVTSSLIEISWKPGKYHRHTQTFVIEYTNLEGNVMKEKEKFDDGNQTMTKAIKYLQPKTKYSIVIFAKNEIGESERTHPLLVETLGKHRKLSN